MDNIIGHLEKYTEANMTCGEYACHCYILAPTLGYTAHQVFGQLRVLTKVSIQ